MRTQISESSVNLWLSENDTYEWANRPNESWPCSTISGHRLFAAFDSGGLVDYAIDGESDSNNNEDIDGNELTAICADHLKSPLAKWAKKHGREHPAYLVAVGQFQS